MAKEKKIVKKVVSHLAEDTRDYRKGIREDKKLKGELRKMVRSKGKRGS